MHILDKWELSNRIYFSKVVRFIDLFKYGSFNASFYLDMFNNL